MYHMGSKSLVTSLIEEAAAVMGIAQQDVRWCLQTGANYVSRGPALDTVVGTGSVIAGVSGAEAVHRLSTTAVLGAISRYLAGNIGGGWTDVLQPMYCKSRMAVSNTLSAGSDMHVGFENSPFNHGVGIGVFQTISAVNFSIVKCASDVYTGVDSGIALNTAQNEFELYRTTAGTWFWRINNGALTSMTTTGQPTSGNEAFGHVHVTNASAAQALTLDLDYCFWAGKKTP